MPKDVVDVKALEPYRLRLRFEDGLEGILDFGDLRFEGVFAPLKGPDFFAQAGVSAELGAVVWPDGASLDPAVLYGQVRQLSAA